MFRRVLRWRFVAVFVLFPHISQCGFGPESFVQEEIVRQYDPGLTLCNEALTVCISER